jgi:hypothetical protein
VKAIPATTVLFGTADFQNELYFMDASKHFTNGIWEPHQVPIKILVKLMRFIK